MEGVCSAIESKGLIGHMESSSTKARSPSILLPKDVRNVIEGILFSPSPALDLSKRGLEHLSEEIFRIPHLKQLHLQRNELSIIPKDFFELLPNLVWLDLRHNKIKAIPSGIGSHKNLKTLLMEKNPIKTLPVELGNLTSLKALNLRNCPLEFPPQDIIQKGLLAILAFLRQWALKQCAVTVPLCQEMKNMDSLKEISKAKHDMAGGSASHKEASQPRKSKQDDPKAKEQLFPHVEKLNLTEVTEASGDFSEDWSNEEEMKQFWKLRQEIVANEKAEILANQLLPIQLPLNLQDNPVKEHVQKLKYSFRIPLKKPCNSRKKSSSFENMFPEIPSYEMPVQAKKDEERRVAALKELKEKHALIEQRKRDKKVLQKWREQAEVMKKEKEILMNTQHLPKDMMLEKAPFATNPVDESNEFNSLEKKKPTQLKLTQEQDELRASKAREIEERIKRHMETFRERRKKARGTPQEEIQKAAHDFEIAKKLHDEVHKRQQDRELRKEYRFTAFTGDVSPQAPMSQPHNIFFNMKF
ncbi:leucine-rich repeat-containing protein 27 [Trichosurus vulpecula]|uniref:leucine-rich repeat-containing protein 27 n=1 Tax=Trichosurus vulpecula TaxID=9337 RepID=UPI00186AE64A|nr:leucine-rich repeat-containing protein 27 [Trichosurus vulpecula]